MAKYFIIFFLGLSATARASVIHTDEIKVSGLGCSGLIANIESKNGQKQLVIRFESLKVILQGEQKDSQIQCDFAIPFEAPRTKSVKFSEPTIVGRANIAPRVNAILNFEMAWPDHRGPDFRVGYDSSRERVTESFSDTGEGTELIFGCGESNDLIGSVGAYLQAGWFYKGALAELETKEVRLNIDDVSCAQ
jgi:hypothetical protein